MTNLGARSIKNGAFQVRERNVMTSSKCPVCDWEIKEGGIKVKVGGKEITVCCDDCVKAAETDPSKYAQAVQ
jgi:ribosome-binding protein aMBF1 (putative translation factor)